MSRSSRLALTALDDSKRLAPEVRATLTGAIMRHCAHVVVLSASSATIDRDGLHITNQRLLREVAHRLAPLSDVCVVDGRPVPDPMPDYLPLVGADHTSASVAAASVIAKTTRDRLMSGPAHRAHPGYAFDSHVGYATAAHRAAVTVHGPCALHRRSFAPIAAFGACGDLADRAQDADGVVR